MKKAKIIFTAILAIGAIGGALAFKAARFNATPAWSFTSLVTLNGASYVYSAQPGLSFCTTYQTAVSKVFRTTTSPNPSIITYYTTAAPTTSIVLSQVAPGTALATIPLYTCVTTRTFTTTAP